MISFTECYVIELYAPQDLSKHMFIEYAEVHSNAILDYILFKFKCKEKNPFVTLLN